MTSPTLASFTATDGTGLWEVTSAGIRATAPCATARTVGGYKPTRFGSLAMRLTRRLTRIVKYGGEA